MNLPARSSTQERGEATPKRIALFGAFGVGNLGNECTLQALLYNIQKHVPNAEISCICPGPEGTRSEYGIPSSLIKELPLGPVKNRPLGLLRRIFAGVPMELLRWIRAIARLKDIDLLVMTGTGMLGDFGITPLGLHYEILKWTIAAKLCKCKVIFLSVGAGPLSQSLSRLFVKTALSCADYRSYRDGFSKDYLQSIRFHAESDYVYPDLAFSFPADALSRNAKQGDINEPIIGIGLITYFNRRCVSPEDETIYRRYLSELGKFVIWLLERRYVVRLIVGDVAYDQRARNDLRAILEERGFTCENRSIIDDPATSVGQVISQLAATEVVVASRFHNVLLALTLGKPVLAISYHEKVEALMADVGLGQFCQDIESIDLEAMTRQFTLLMARSAHIKQQLDCKSESWRTALDDQYCRIFDTYLR